MNNQKSKKTENANPKKEFAGKVVLVTGSSRGIGRAIAVTFAKLGANVVINYHNSKLDADIAKAVIKSYGVECIAIKANIAKDRGAKHLVTEAYKKFGRIDILVNNAGIVFDESFEDRTIKHWSMTLNTNLIGTYLVSKYASKYMLQQKWGRIVNISSTNGIHTTSPESIDYDSSKAGIIVLTRNLATQFAPYINVNSVAPGWVDTDMNKDLPKDYVQEETQKILLKRFATSEEIANVVVFLASDRATYINGTTIKVDGGYL